jgi:hypothetical protein
MKMHTAATRFAPAAMQSRASAPASISIRRTIGGLIRAFDIDDAGGER